MSDNVTLPAAAGKAASRDVTYSGEAAQAQAVGIVAFSGSDDAKTAADVPAGGGTEATALRVTIASDSTGVVSIDDNGAALTVDNGGTFATQVDGAALTALQLIDNPVFVDDAAYTVGTSSVMVSGGVAVAHGSAPDAADAGDAVAPLCASDMTSSVTTSQGARIVSGTVDLRPGTRVVV